MAELADAYGSGPYECKFMQVQVLLPAPNENPVFRLKTAWILGFSHLYALFSVSQKCLKSPQKPLNFASCSTKYNTKAHVQRTGPLFSFLQKNLLSVNRKTANPLLSFLCSHKRFRYKNSVVLKLFGEVGRPDSSKAYSLRMPRLRLCSKIPASAFLYSSGLYSQSAGVQNTEFSKS